MAYIARHDWDLAQTAINVVASAEVSAYGAVQLIGENAARPAKLTGTTGSFVLQFASAIQPDYAMLAYHYLDAGLGNVKIQGNTSNSWGAPAFSATFTIPSKRLDGPSYQRWTRNPVLALTGNPSYAWWRLSFESANSQQIIVGRLLLLSQLQRVDLFHVDGSAFDETDETREISNVTELDVEAGIYALGGPRRTLGFYTVGTDLNAGTAPIQEAEDFREIHESSEGRTHPFVMLPFENFADGWLVRPVANNMPRSHRQDGSQIFPIAVREIARGLPWP